MNSPLEYILGLIAVAAALVSIAVMACVALAAACEAISLAMAEEASGVEPKPYHKLTRCERLGMPATREDLGHPVHRVLELNPSAVRRVA